MRGGGQGGYSALMFGAMGGHASLVRAPPALHAQLVQRHVAIIRVDAGCHRGVTNHHIPYGGPLPALRARSATVYHSTI